MLDALSDKEKSQAKEKLNEIKQMLTEKEIDPQEGMMELAFGEDESMEERPMMGESSKKPKVALIIASMKRKNGKMAS